MLVPVFLALSALIWLPYGLYCFFQPAFLAEAAGVAAVSPSGETELRAMYGGLQAAVGLLCGLALFRPSLRRPALVTVAFVVGGLFVARLGGAGIGVELSVYTGSALLLELGMLGVAILCLRGERV